VIITDLLGARVFGPDFVGFVTDARFRLRRFRHRCAVLPSSVSSPMPGSASTPPRQAVLPDSTELLSAHMPGPHP
jgi:hypothetical protein